MTLQPTTATDAGSMPAPEIPPALQEPAPEIPLAPKGYTGPSSFPRSLAQDDFLPIPDRWRIGFPTGYRPDVGGFGHVWDPYNQNVLKGDYPFWGNDKFIEVTATSDTLFETRRTPIPSGVSSLHPGSTDFFGNGKQYLINQNLILSASIFKGDAGYRPHDWEVRITPVINYNYLQAEEVGVVDVDVSKGRYRHDNWVGLQEAFVEARLPYESRNFDFTSVRAGIQPFQADFKGFLYSDNNLGLRFFGNKDNNRIQYNLAWFHQLEKDTNSGLNSYTMRDQDIFIANVFFQDSLKYFRNHSTNPKLLGLTTEFTFAANIDRSGNGIQKDDNGFIVRPQPVGSIHDKDVRAYYLGFGTDGHIGRYNLSTQFYQALGSESLQRHRRARDAHQCTVLHDRVELRPGLDPLSRQLRLRIRRSRSHGRQRERL